MGPLESFDDEETDREDNPKEQGSNDRAMAPCFGLPTPLQNQAKAYQGGEYETEAWYVQARMIRGRGCGDEGCASVPAHVVELAKFVG